MGEGNLNLYRLYCHVTLGGRARVLVIIAVHARALTDERAQLRSRRLTDGGGLTRSQGRKCLWKTGRNSGFLSAMKGEQTENGEKSTNSVSAKDDGTAINITSDMFASECLRN